MSHPLRYIPVLILCLLFNGMDLHAQNMSSLRIRDIPVLNDTMILDTLSMVPGTLNIFKTEGRLPEYRIDEMNARIIWSSMPEEDTLRFVYRVFPLSLTRPVFHQDIRDITEPVQDETNMFSYSPGQSPRQLMDFGSLDYNGSFARGISFGNNQNVVVNSNFNLQLSGMITDDIEILAALTDNNIPIQPDGNTQQLQEFDRIFIQLRKDQHKLVVGDYEIRNPNSYFMYFVRKLQGLSYSGSFDFKPGMYNQQQLSLAIARGKFTRNQLQVIEGNQGPYRLKGENGETFLIVLAGTERVYIDGQLMERGADKDYVIDYNLGEITFMPSRIITKDLRIIVEFEYSEQNYLRTFAYAYDEFQKGKFKLNVNLYSQQDSKNQPIQQDLNDAEKEILRNVGDSLTDAQISGATAIEFDNERIMYKLRDSLVNGILYDSVFVRSTNPDSAEYVVSFTFVGANNGDYLLSSSTVNGRIYRWVAPVGGVPQGNYSPIRILIAPQSRQLLTVGMEYKLSENGFVSLETGLSNKDINTFSSINDEDDKGLATKLRVAEKFKLKEHEGEQLFMTLSGSYEFVHKNFQQIERYRPVEFERDWNISTLNDRNNEHLADLSAGLERSKLGFVRYTLSGFIRQDIYDGFRHGLDSRLAKNGFTFLLKSSFLHSNSPNKETKFFRPTTDFSKVFAKAKDLKIGLYTEQEINRINLTGVDSLENNSFSYHRFDVYLKNPDTASYHYGLSIGQRYDLKPDGDGFIRSAMATNLSVNGTINAWKHQILRWQFNFRDLQTDDSLANVGELKRSYLGRLEYSATALKGFLRTDMLYELGAGSEQRREFSFVSDPTRQGNYQWIDRNENGIQELGEFEIIPVGFEPDTIYIRVFTPTNEFIPVNITTYNQSLSLNPRALWYKEEGALKFLSRFSTLTTLQITRKAFQGASVSLFNPFVIDIVDTNLVSIASNIRNSVFYNRTDNVYGLEYAYQDSRNRDLLTSGFESRSLFNHIFKVRWNIRKYLGLNITYTKGDRRNNSENFSDRDYRISSHKISPKWTIQPGTKWRVSLSYNFHNQKNIELINQGEKANIHQIEAEMRFNVVTKSTFNTRFSFASVKYEGSNNTPIEFAMLQGLQDGRNYIWSASFDRKIGDRIQMSLIYDGRKTGSAKMIHTGRAQVTALF